MSFTIDIDVKSSCIKLTAELSEHAEGLWISWCFWGTLQSYRLSLCSTDNNRIFKNKKETTKQ
jgi:hypothetical protein